MGQSADAKTLSWSEARYRILEDSNLPKIVGEEWRVPLNWIHETDPLQINPILRAPFNPKTGRSCGLVVKAPASEAGGPVFESLKRFGLEARCDGSSLPRAATSASFK